MKPRRRSAGMAMMTAIFLIVVLAVIGGAMVTLSNVEHDTSTKSLQQAKAYFGAKAGLEWGIQQAIATSTCAAGPTAFTIAQGGLANVSVSVTCSSSTHGVGNTVYYIAATATLGTLGRLDYAERRMEATVSNIP